jgi:hypothetical protein
LRETSEIPSIFSVPIEQSLIPNIQEDDEEDEVDRNNGKTDRPKSTRRKHKKSNSMTHHPAYTRAISTDCSPSKPSKPAKHHRRSKSDIEFSNNKKEAAALPKVPQFQRNISTRSSTREFYAAPTYTIASLLERSESMRHKKTKPFVEKLDYQASSPDEKALVEASAKQGIIYLNDDRDILRIKVRIKKVSYYIISLPKSSMYLFPVLSFQRDRQ